MRFKKGDLVKAVDGPDLGLKVRVAADSDSQTFMGKRPGSLQTVSLTSAYYIQVAEPPPWVSPPPAKPADWRMQYDNSSARRKDQPVAEGVLKYFPAALRLLAEVSRLGNEKHNPGEPLHHARGKSSDHLDCAARHIMDADSIDADTGLIEAVLALWRIAAYVQEKCERDYGWPKAPNARG